METGSSRRVVCLVVGTRPEVIKMAPVYKALQRSERLQPLLLSTGQHRQMLDQALADFELKPDCDLELMQPAQSLSALTSRAIARVAGFLEESQPDAILVQGDTTTVLASAIAAFYRGIPVGHVEAGLRTRNLQSPWPEEMNRRLISPICRWNFAPTEWARINLVSEQVPAEKCFVTGNTVVDALLWMRGVLHQRGPNASAVAERLKLDPQFADRYLRGDTQPFVLVTGHRRESFGAGLQGMCEGLLQLCRAHPDLGAVYPVHLNPSVRGPVQELLGGHQQIALTEPAGYEDFVWLMDRCRFIISDSGGIQEEAPCLGKPVLVTRNETERPEGVQAGTSRLVGTDAATILREGSILLSDADAYERRSRLSNPYGDGHAAVRICRILEATL